MARPQRIQFTTTIKQLLLEIGTCVSLLSLYDTIKSELGFMNHRGSLNHCGTEKVVRYSRAEYEGYLAEIGSKV